MRIAKISFPPKVAAALGRALLPALLASAALVIACQHTAPQQAALSAQQLAQRLAATHEDAAAGSLRIRLAFGAGADLDLYVTDEASTESVYFAKSQTRGGGRLLRDARCGDAVPRSDLIAYEKAQPGRYRIGVDYHSSCGAAEPAKTQAFVVEVTQGKSVQRRAGLVALGQQLLVFSEVEVEAPSSDDASSR